MNDGDPILTFQADWRVEQSGVLVASSRVRVRYAVRRLLGGPDLAPTGQHSFSVTGFYRIDDGVPVTLDLGGRRPPEEEFVERTIELPRTARRLELWFQRVSLYGAPRYDSDYGRNFTFPVYPALDTSSAVRRFVGELTGAR